MMNTLDRSMIMHMKKENTKQKQKNNRPETACGQYTNTGSHHNFRMPSNKVLKEANSTLEKIGKNVIRK